MSPGQDQFTKPFVPAEYDWLGLRFAADQVSRDSGLLQEVVDHIVRKKSAESANTTGAPLRVVDFGAGAGANLLHLAPRLQTPEQTWYLIDRDPALMQRVQACFAAFSRTHPDMRAQGNRVTFGSTNVTYRALTGDFLSPDNPAYREQPDLVVANAVFDLMSAEQFAVFLQTAIDAWRPCRPLVYFTINLDRALFMRPIAAQDASIIGLYHRHMQREQAFGRAMGPESASEMVRQMRACGLRVADAPSPWVVSTADNSALLAANLDLIESATKEMIAAGLADGLTKADIDRWLAHKRERIAQGALVLEMANRDILATWD